MLKLNSVYSNCPSYPICFILGLCSSWWANFYLYHHLGYYDDFTSSLRFKNFFKLADNCFTSFWYLMRLLYVWKITSFYHLGNQQHQHIVFLNFYLFLDFSKIYLCDFIMIIKFPAVFQVWVFLKLSPSSWGVNIRHSFTMGKAVELQSSISQIFAGLSFLTTQREGVQCHSSGEGRSHPFAHSTQVYL